jgi:hypothetical protein
MSKKLSDKFVYGYIKEERFIPAKFYLENEKFKYVFNNLECTDEEAFVDKVSYINQDGGEIFSVEQIDQSQAESNELVIKEVISGYTIGTVQKTIPLAILTYEDGSWVFDFDCEQEDLLVRDIIDDIDNWEFYDTNNDLLDKDTLIM